MRPIPGMTDPAALLHRLTGTETGPVDPLLDENEAPSPASRPILITADALLRKVFPDPRWAVPGLFPEGLSIFAGPPKIGKSWLCLNVAVAVAAGGVAIGKIPVAGGDVLYLSLEDTERRMQERLAIALQGEAPSARLDIATAWPTLADGAAHHLRQWLLEHRDARLVIVDTFQRLRGPVPGNQSLYANDYAAAGELKRVADDSGVALVLVHHTRKATADDPLDMVSGTAGLAGAADTTLVLRKEIGRSDANLYLRGRDVPEADHALTFDPESCSWSLLGDAAAYRRSTERQDIIDLLNGSPEPMRPKAIAEALGKKDGAVRFLLHRMVKGGEIDGLGGDYRIPPTPSNAANRPNGSDTTPGTAGRLAAPPVRGTSPTTNASLTPKHPGPREHVTIVSDVSGVSTEGDGREAEVSTLAPVPVNGRPRRIWICADCNTPRSQAPEPCPSCGATGGGWIVPAVGDDRRCGLSVSTQPSEWLQGQDNPSR